MRGRHKTPSGPGPLLWRQHLEKSLINRTQSHIASSGGHDIYSTVCVFFSDREFVEKNSVKKKASLAQQADHIAKATTAFSRVSHTWHYTTQAYGLWKPEVFGWIRVP